MIGAKKKSQNFSGLVRKLEADINERFPNISNSIQSINIDSSPISGAVRSAGVFINVDSNVCTKDISREHKPAVRTEIPEATKKYIDKTMDALIKKGVSEEEAEKKVKDALVPCMGYDKDSGQYVVSAMPPVKEGATYDSILERTSIPMWNIGWLTKIFKQPFATSHAKNLVSVESFSNPWADVIGVFKESFEGYGKLSNTARGNFKQNNSNPVTNEASTIVDEVYNISVDYESDVMEDIKASQAGNFVTGQIKADREKYAMMVLDRMQDALIYFGDKETGILGLQDVAPVEVYADTPLYEIFSGNDATAGAKIVKAMNKLIGDFLRQNHYMARELKINVSEYAFQALTQALYSDQFSPASPIKVLNGNFKAQNELDGGLVQCKYTIVSDTMCNPRTPFNPSDYDMAFMTVPTISDALTGEQSSLVIHPELLKSYMIPALWQRSGILYTAYRRISGIIAPIEGTVKVVMGLGVDLS